MLLVSMYLSGTASPNLRAQRRELLPLPIEEAIQSANFPAWVPISLSPDGKWVAFTLHDAKNSTASEGSRYSKITRSGAPSPLAGSDIWIANTRTGQSRNLTGGKGTSWAPVWSPDGRFLAFDSDRDGQSRLWLWERPTDKLRQVSSEIITTGDTFDGAQWAPDGKKVVIRVLPAGMKVEDLLDVAYGPAQQSAKAGISSAKVVESHESSDSSTPLPPASDSSTDFDILFSDLAAIDISTGDVKRIAHKLRLHSYRLSPDGCHVAVMSYIWTINAGTFRSRRITNTNPQFDGVELGASQLINWRNLDGLELKGALLLPAGYIKGKQYPTVVYVYGGLHLSTQVNEWMSSIVINPQLLATRGYVILFPDAPQRLGTPVQDLASAVFPAISKLIDLGIADPERLGIMGHSYGGYSTLALIEQSKQFRAAVDIAGTTNLMNAYAKSGAGGGTIGWVEEGQGDMGGSLWQHRERFVENSPLFYLDRIQTPILLMHGGSDTAVPPIESHIAFESLRSLGKEATYVEYAGEEHIPSQWSNANQVDYCERIMSWFDKYVKGGRGH